MREEKRVRILATCPGCRKVVMAEETLAQVERGLTQVCDCGEVVFTTTPHTVLEEEEMVAVYSTDDFYGFGPPLRSTLGGFIEANKDAPLSPEDVERIAALAVGESVKVGGGGAAEFTITRGEDEPRDMRPIKEGDRR